MGANRIELCSDLEPGGVTPHHELIHQVLETVNLPVQVIIRPRGGDFVYDSAERKLILDQITKVKNSGISGIVFGALTKANNIDIQLLKDVIECSYPLKVTFHKAFDLVSDPFFCLEKIIVAGCERILTSGTAGNVLEGVPVLAELVHQSKERISIMPGGGLRSNNVLDVMQSNAYEFHSSALTTGQHADTYEIAAIRHQLDQNL